jgi:glycosyltransferase involved in cell wall biosynthesis
MREGPRVKVAHLDTGRTWRGGQAQVLLLIEGLRRRGIENLLLAPPGPLLDRARSLGIDCRVWRVRAELDPIAVLTGSRALAGVDVAHAHSAHAHAAGVPAARLARVPAVVVSRRVDFEVAKNPLSRLKYRLPVDRYLCISRGVEEVLRKARIPESRLARVPSGVAFHAPPASTFDLRQAIGAAPSDPVVGTVAALAPHKNHADLMRAAALVIRARPETRFVWLGEGECRAALERQRAELGLERHVHLLGFREDALALVPQFTVFALASYLEGLCTSLIDAQRLGVPVVASRTGGIPDVIEDGVNGRLVPPRDPEALAAAILEALADPARRASWAAAGLVTAPRFSADHMVEGTLEVYRAVLREHGRDHALD